MIRLYSYIALFLVLICTGCSDLKKGLGMEKDVPDEFLIKKNNPIVKPPNYDLLPPDSKSKNDKISIKTPGDITGGEKSSGNSEDLKKLLNDTLNKNSSSNNQKPISNTSSGSEDLILKKIIDK